MRLTDILPFSFDLLHHIVVYVNTKCIAGRGNEMPFRLGLSLESAGRRSVAGTECYFSGRVINSSSGEAHQVLLPRSYGSRISAPFRAAFLIFIVIVPFSVEFGVSNELRVYAKYFQFVASSIVAGSGTDLQVGRIR
jgi:hypothetical protein